MVGRKLFRRARLSGYTSTREQGLRKDGGIAAESRWGELLAEAQRGDAVAYRLFLASIIPFARALARRRTWSEEVAEDVVQDVLLTVHRIRHTYEPGRPVKPWLAAIVARRSIDEMRKRGRVTAREVHDEAAYETYSDPGANNQNAAHEAAHNAAELARMTEGLSPRQKEALKLVKVKEMTLAEASALSGQSVASLKVNIHRALKKMRLDLSKDQGE